MKKLLFILILVINSYSNELFTLADESNFIKEKIRYEKLRSKEAIFIEMYNFLYKKILKKLIKILKKKVKKKIFFGKKKD